MPLPKIYPLYDAITNPEQRSDIEKFIYNQVEYLRTKTQSFRESVMPTLVDIYKGKPQTEEKTFPWPKASNLVIQLAATHADELLSRIMAIYQTDQLFVAQLLGDWEDGTGDEERAIIEEFMSDVALDPFELDLYRTEEIVFGSAIKYGVGIVKFPWMFEQEQVYTGSESPSLTSSFKLETMKDNPNPANVPANLFLIDPDINRLHDAGFIGHMVPYKKWQLRQLLEREKDTHIFDTEKLKTLIEGSPDRDGPNPVVQAQEDSKGMNNNWANVGSEWEITECWFAWYINGKKYRILAHWHHKTRTLLGGIFNPYPMNQIPFEDAKLAYDDDQYYGYGFCEMLEHYQIEVSRNHNQRVDNRDLANTGVVRVDVGSSLASVIQIYPGAVIPAPKGELEVMAMGQAMTSTSEDEQLTLGLAKDRSGVDPAVGGTGGGIVNQKRGVYSAQGTAIAMQSINNRNNLRMSDMRSAHVRIGDKLLQQYSTYGVRPSRLRSYGDRASTLKAALEHYRNGKLGLLIKPATASNNKELEKQNDLLLLQTMERQQQSDMQMVASIATQQGMPPELKAYMAQCFLAKNALFTRILREFEHPDVKRLAPIPELIQQLKEQMNGKGNSTRSIGGNPNRQSLGQASSVPSQTGSTVPLGGVSGTNSGVPQLQAGGGNPEYPLQ